MLFRSPATLEHPYALSEEVDPSGQGDTCRFLAAGAQRSYWLRTAAGQLGNALPALNSILQSSRNVIVESNSILQFFKPHLYVVVLDFTIEDFKPTSLEYLDRADALIVIERGKQQPHWSGVARRLWDSKPQFFFNAASVRHGCRGGAGEGATQALDCLACG